MEHQPIKFKRQADGDYTATVDGIEFHIWNASVDRKFGITVYRDKENITHLGSRGFGIYWCGTKKRCVEHAERVLRVYSLASLTIVSNQAKEA